MAKQSQETEGFAYMPDHQSEFVPVQKWVRVFLGGWVIADSKRPLLLRQARGTPVYYFPQEDVRMEALAPSEHRTLSDTFGKAFYWNVQAGGKVAENAAWQYVDLPQEASSLKVRIAFEWNKMDAWFEEDEQVYAHPHDPFHRIDIRHSSRHVKVVIAGETVAETHHPTLLFETGLPVRYYIPRLDVRQDLIIPSEKVTWCAYKWRASHYSIQVGDQLVKDIAWSYPFPNPELAKIQNLFCFYNERLDDFYVDGELVPKPKTPWSEA